jgi:glycerol uptake facilitator-like aquaporin
MEYGLPDVKSSGRVYFTVLMFEFLGTAFQVMAFNYSFNNYITRATAYFVTWILASTISGAHFNPVLSLAVYMSQR